MSRQCQVKNDVQCSEGDKHMAGYPWLRMKQLPKSEYTLMKTLIDRWQLTDESELFCVAMHLMEEVALYDPPRGETWLHQVIATWRKG
jgi:hypothetical protein